VHHSNNFTVKSNPVSATRHYLLNIKPSGHMLY